MPTEPRFDTSKIRFAPSGCVYLAPAVGATLPTTVGDGTAAPVGFKSLGYLSDAGVQITPAVTTEPVNVWQSATPVLYNVTAATFSISATFIESSVNTTELFYGAQWVESPGASGTYRLDLASTPELQELSIVVDWSQGDVHNRVVIPRAMIQDRGSISLVRTSAQEYQLTIEALDSNGTLGYVLTDQDMSGA